MAEEEIISVVAEMVLKEEDVLSIVWFPNALAIKATIVRPLPSGALGERAEELADTFDAVFALTAKPCSLEDALQATPANLRRMAQNLVNILQLARR